MIVSNGHIEEVEATKREVKQFLETELFLELSEEKTLVTHVNDGFDFLGFHLRRVVNHKGHWATHLRPSEKAKKRVKEKIKDLTSINWTWMDEFTRLTTLNSIVRGWANYYRHTFLVRDIEEITRYTWHRYLLWLLNKHKGSRKRQLIKDKTRVVHNRTRWTAKVCQGEELLEAYQWLPTRKELRRTTYLLKGKDGFPHPYIFVEEFAAIDYPMGETGPPESIYTRTIGVRSAHPSRNEPQNITVLNLKAKMRDGFQCQKCGTKSKLHVHHIEGTNDIIWALPTSANVRDILQNPAYAGAYVYGRRKVDRARPRLESPQGRIVRLPIDRWEVCIQDAFPAYITWEEFVANQKRLAANQNNYRQNRHGATREGLNRPGFPGDSNS